MRRNTFATLGTRGRHEAHHFCNTWRPQDVVDGPWMCTDPRPFANMDGVFVRQEHVTLFDLREGLTESSPDLVMMFGTWRNVLSDDVLEEQNIHPTLEQRRAMNVQNQIFDDGCEFLATGHAAILAQTRSSLLSIGPTVYMMTPWLQWSACSLQQQGTFGNCCRDGRRLLQNLGHCLCGAVKKFC